MSDCGMPLLPEIVTHVFEINYSTYGNLAPFVIECIERLGVLWTSKKEVCRWCWVTALLCFEFALRRI